MESEKKFRTKTGFCHILPDKILLTRDGVIGNFSQIAVGNKISRILIIYSMLVLFLFYEAYELFMKDNYLVIAFIFCEYIYLFYINYFQVKEYKLLPSNMYMTEIGVFYILLIVIIGMVNGIGVLFEMASFNYQMVMLAGIPNPNLRAVSDALIPSVILSPKTFCLNFFV